MQIMWISLLQLFKWDRKALNKWAITSPCAHAPYSTLGMNLMGMGCPCGP